MRVKQKSEVVSVERRWQFVALNNQWSFWVDGHWLVQSWGGVIRWPPFTLTVLGCRAAALLKVSVETPGVPHEAICLFLPCRSCSSVCSQGWPASASHKIGCLHSCHCFYAWSKWCLVAPASEERRLWWQLFLVPGGLLPAAIILSCTSRCSSFGTGWFCFQ